MLKLISAYLYHLQLACSCRHNGNGLPLSWKSPAFAFLFLLGTATYTIRLWLSTHNLQVVPVSIVSFVVSIALVRVFTGQGMNRFICVYLLASTGVDLIVIANHVAGVELPGAIPSGWKIICFLVGWVKVGRQVDAVK